MLLLLIGKCLESTDYYKNIMKINEDYSGIILENDKGKFLFQLRDNNPRIPNPNKWSLFGGGIKRGESPKQAVIREVKEELGFKLDKSKLKILFKKESKKNRRFVFYYKLQNEQKYFRLKEGQKYGFLSLSEIIFKKNVVPSLRIFMLLYPFLKRKVVHRKV